MSFNCINYTASNVAVIANDVLTAIRKELVFYFIEMHQNLPRGNDDDNTETSVLIASLLDMEHLYSRHDTAT